MTNKRRCNSCGKEGSIRVRACVSFINGKRIYCGFMRMVRDGE